MQKRRQQVFFFLKKNFFFVFSFVIKITVYCPQKYHRRFRGNGFGLVFFTLSKRGQFEIRIFPAKQLLKKSVSLFSSKIYCIYLSNWNIDVFRLTTSATK